MKLLKKATAVVIAVTIMIGGSSCRIRSASERFDSYIESTFKSMVSGDILSSNFLIKDPEAMGVEKGLITFGGVSPDDMRFEAIRAEMSRIENFFSYDKLTASQQITYDMLMEYFSTELMAEGLGYYYEYCLGSSAVNTYIPTLLAEFNFYEESYIEDYFSLLGTIGEFFDEIAEFEKQKSEKGLFMSDESLDGFLEANDVFVKSGEDNVLIESFNERIDAMELDEEKAAGYKEKNKEIVTETVFPAYNKLSEDMEKLRGTGTNEGGLAGLPEGKKYYEYLAASQTGSSKSMDEIYNMIKGAYAESLTGMQTIIMNDPEILTQLENLSFGTNDPVEILETLKEAIKKDYPEIPDVQYTVKYVSESLEDSLSPAFYMTPPIDDVTNNVIYINGSERYKNMNLFSTLAHEGYPGHLYQSVYFSSSQTDNLRKVMKNLGYTEGWASYVEMQSFEYAGFSEDIVKLLQYGNVLDLSLLAWIDIEINYYGKDFEWLKNMLNTQGITDEETCKFYYRQMIEAPASYLPYAVGLLEILELREYTEEQLGDNFSLIDFHKAVLDPGSVPFSIVREQVEKYISGVKALEEDAA